MTSQEAAWREMCAVAPRDVFLIETLSLSSNDEVLNVMRGYGREREELEALDSGVGAVLDGLDAEMVPLIGHVGQDAGGGLVAYIAVAMSIKTPEQEPSGNPEIKLTIDNVSGHVSALFDAAIAAGDVISAVYRRYRSDSVIPLTQDVMVTMRGGQVTATTAEVGMGIADFALMDFPRRRVAGAQFRELLQ